MKADISTEYIKKAQNGDLAALKKLLRIAERSIFAYLNYLTDEETERDDIAQEILLKITKNIKNLKEPKHFKSWLNKIILRQYYDYIRKYNKEKIKIVKDDISDVNETETICDKKKTPAENCISGELCSVIKDSVCKLQEPYRLAILMREFQGLSYDEIAKLTNTNVGTIKSRIARARSRLKEYIKPYME